MEPPPQRPAKAGLVGVDFYVVWELYDSPFMYAIIQTGGKQYRVAKGDLVDVEKLPIEAGKEVRFNEVLFVGGDSPRVGSPYLPNAEVVGEVVSQFRGEKLIVYKYKRRKGYDKKQGHRQDLTKVKIVDIKSE